MTGKDWINFFWTTVAALNFAAWQESGFAGIFIWILILLFLKYKEY